MTPELICGIDPGKHGGISLLDLGGAVVGSYAMPDTEQEIAEVLAEFAPRIARVLIERSQPVPKFGCVAMFKLGQSYGFLRGLLVSLQLRYDETRPQDWQKALGCLSKGKKAVTRQKAQQLFPGTRITDKNADSLLIAEYGRRLA